jgi:hypothetical protein
MTRTHKRKNGGTASTESAIQGALYLKHSRGISFRKSVQEGISKQSSSFIEKV